MLKYPRIRTIEVYMGANEWGNALMEKIAGEVASNIPWPVVVNVNEHAGWRMGFFFGEGNVNKIVSTANDGAVFDQSVEVLREHIHKAKLDFLPEIRRPDNGMTPRELAIHIMERTPAPALDADADAERHKR